MAKLTAKQRSALKPSTFALPAERRFPMPDKTHARAALSGASRALNVGTITKTQKVKIDAKAHRKLGK